MPQAALVTARALTAQAVLTTAQAATDTVPAALVTPRAALFMDPAATGRTAMALARLPRTRLVSCQSQRVRAALLAQARLPLAMVPAVMDRVALVMRQAALPMSRAALDTALAAPATDRAVLATLQAALAMDQAVPVTDRTVMVLRLSRAARLRRTRLVSSPSQRVRAALPPQARLAPATARAAPIMDLPTLDLSLRPAPRHLHTRAAVVRLLSPLRVPRNQVEVGVVGSGDRAAAVLTMDRAATQAV